ncbi:hypothetical protein SDC9_144677 [bioreactor metagenome]|uniref:Uncharacterized protein n=1 Tax=bioreactor metagenome TaxID=1076179 RepID=A0A645E6Q5_9ZZZZ
MGKALHRLAEQRAPARAYPPLGEDVLAETHGYAQESDFPAFLRVA